MLKELLVGSLLSLLGLNAWAGSLCNTNEVESFSCNVNQKVVSVCVTKGEDMIYRFGKVSSVELELLSDVHFSSTAYSGGGEERLTFANGNYQYIVYSGISNGEWLDEESGLREKVEFAGIYVLKNATMLADFKCTSFDDKNYIHSLPPHVEEEFSYFD